MDNAAVHNDNPATQAAFDRLTDYGVHIRRLPTYSPELNPCELVFAQINNYLRTAPRRLLDNMGRLVDIPFSERLNDAMSRVTFQTVDLYYNKCKRAEKHRR